MSVPLPNETLDGSVVIASCYHSDDVEGCVILLNPTSPYFTIAYVNAGVTERVDDQRNIIGAVKAYVDHGGDPGDFDIEFS